MIEPSGSAEWLLPERSDLSYTHKHCVHAGRPPEPCSRRLAGTGGGGALWQHARWRFSWLAAPPDELAAATWLENLDRGEPLRQPRKVYPNLLLR